MWSRAADFVAVRGQLAADFVAALGFFLRVTRTA
jgi:hypothetical protein